MWFQILIVSLFLHKSLTYYFRTKKSLKWLQKNVDAPAKREGKNKLIILIPVFKETEIIESSVAYFNRFSSPKIKIFYITTAKEKGRNTTSKQLKKLRHKYTFDIMHYPFTEGNKADQLNWAIKKLGTSLENLYFGIYDVDSKPTPNVFSYVSNGKEAVYQQFSFYFKNYFNLKSYLLKAGAILQTKWVLEYEIEIYKDTFERIKRGQAIKDLVYCTGHGLFIRADIFKKIGVFSTSTLTEDLEFGYRLSFYRIPICPLPTIDFVEYAPSLSSSVIQTSRWYSGEFDLFKYYLNSSARSSYNFWLVLKRYYYILGWAFGPMLVVYTLIIGFTKNLLLLPFIFFALIFYINLPLREIYLSYLKGNSIENMFLLHLAVYFKALLNSLGPMHYFITLILYSIRGKKRLFIKTSRIES